MTKRTVLLVLLAVFAATSARPVEADEPAIRKAIDAYMDAFNRHEVEILCACWTEKGTHIDRDTGERTEGRAALQKDIEEAMKQSPECRLAGRVDHVRLIRSDVAGVDGQTTMEVPGEDPIVSSFSAILVNNDGKWLIESIEERSVPEPTSSREGLRPLEWLIGDWVDESDDVRVETTFRWSHGEAFLLRSFIVERAGSPEQQGTQIIGWDPRSQQIRSWTFNSDGSFGDGIWSKNGDDWLIRTSQALPNGQGASGTFVMTPVDENSLSLQLIGHEVDGEPRPTNPPVRIVRVQEDKTPFPNESNEQDSVE